MTDALSPMSLSATPPVDVEALEGAQLRPREELLVLLDGVVTIYMGRTPAGVLPETLSLLSEAAERIRADVSLCEEIKRLRASSVSPAVDDGALLEALDGNEIWEALFSILKGDVPLSEDVCQELADWINAAIGDVKGPNVRQALDKLEATGCWWIIGKGRTREDEPLYGVQIMRGESDDVERQAECEDLPTAVRAALAPPPGGAQEGGR